MLYIGFEDKECYLYTIHLRVVIGNVFISEGFSMLSYMLPYLAENAKFQINRYIYIEHYLLLYMSFWHTWFFLSNQNMQMANAYLYCKVKYVRRTSPSRRLHGKQLNYPSYLSKTLKYDMVLPINFYLVRKKYKYIYLQKAKYRFLNILVLFL